ncbi:MAG: T9SS type A sorting domain-containing protein [Bacteroidota bacterium]
MRKFYLSLVVVFLLPNLLTSQTFSISGQITRHNGDPIENIILPWFGMTTTTDANGMYEFTDVPVDGPYELQPLGQFNKFDDVTILDLIELRRHIIQVSIFDFIPLLESDVNSSETVTPLDLFKMQELALRLPMSQSANENWKFCSMTPDCLVPVINPAANDNLVLDFIGIKVGDPAVSADYVPAPPTAPSPIFATSAVSFQAGDEVEVKVTVADFKNIAGLQNSFSWDANLLDFQSIESPVFQIESNLSMAPNGVMGVHALIFDTNIAGSGSLSDGEVLFTLKFDALAAAPSLEQYVDITDDLIPIQTVWENPTDNELFLLQGQYITGEIPTSIYDPIAGLNQFEIFPNPVPQTLNINAAFENVQRGEVHVVDVLGRVLYTEAFNQEALNIEIDMSSFSSGNYFVSLRTAEGVASKLIFKE